MVTFVYILDTSCGTINNRLNNFVLCCYTFVETTKNKMLGTFFVYNPTL